MLFCASGYGDLCLEIQRKLQKTRAQELPKESSDVITDERGAIIPLNRIRDRFKRKKHALAVLHKTIRLRDQSAVRRVWRRLQPGPEDLMAVMAADWTKREFGELAGALSAPSITYRGGLAYYRTESRVAQFVCVSSEVCRSGWTFPLVQVVGDLDAALEVKVSLSMEGTLYFAGEKSPTKKSARRNEEVTFRMSSQSRAPRVIEVLFVPAKRDEEKVSYSLSIGPSTKKIAYDPVG